MKPLASMTTGEAEAHRDGFRDGWKLGFEAGLEHAPPPQLTTLPGGSDDNDPCHNDNPSQMCPRCTCWKAFREYCS